MRERRRGARCSMRATCRRHRRWTPAAAPVDPGNIRGGGRAPSAAAARPRAAAGTRPAAARASRAGASTATRPGGSRHQPAGNGHSAQRRTTSRASPSRQPEDGGRASRKRRRHRARARATSGGSAGSPRPAEQHRRARPRERAEAGRGHTSAASIFVANGAIRVPGGVLDDGRANMRLRFRSRERREHRTAQPGARARAGRRASRSPASPRGLSDAPASGRRRGDRTPEQEEQQEEQQQQHRRRRRGHALSGR